MLQPDWRGQVEECGGPAESLPDAVTGQLSLVGPVPSHLLRPPRVRQRSEVRFRHRSPPQDVTSLWPGWPSSGRRKSAGSRWYPIWLLTNRNPATVSSITCRPAGAGYV